MRQRYIGPETEELLVSLNSQCISQCDNLRWPVAEQEAEFSVSEPGYGAFRIGESVFDQERVVGAASVANGDGCLVDDDIRHGVDERPEQGSRCVVPVPLRDPVREHAMERRRDDGELQVDIDPEGCGLPIDHLATGQ